ncbi:PREDICTED: E3 ubiquitin ligase BIG BROTHER-related [Tarenaya hassleriana]|uniref:E3 ubiquitin ligase BIG BROTHER-related n=1 Tax=Tarenaya hassleriana TaxID=28532 RepID=UPI00053C3382|nr:PREDICTED: E3 ubiquitin ligase BIG BROTHER-related [Tarenaya hassleriana]XP_010530209.1 PREDICTED: E3 ubiquitin ligase BIG BROTHER-related [Tarenaya hassleriana]
MGSQEEDPKQQPPPRKVPDLTFFEQANSDFALAASRANSHFTLTGGQSNPSFAPARLSTIESGEETEEGEDEEEDDDEEISSGSGMDDNDYEYFDSNGFEEEVDGLDEFLGDEESSNDPEDDDFLEDDEIDPDELSYEELIALGEFIGVEKRGLDPGEISTCLNEFKYVSSQIKNGIDRCVVCQMEFQEGESLVILRPCDHPYHSECVTKWLRTKKICPICGSEPSSLDPTVGE